MALGAQPFNYTDALDALPNTILAYASHNSVKDAGGVIEVGSAPEAGLFETAANGAQAEVGTAGLVADTDGAFAAAGAVSGLGDGSSLSGVTDAGAYVLAETALNIFVGVKIQLLLLNYNNGQDRSQNVGSYFDVVQPYQHHTQSRCWY